jgi:RNase adaptor protein for sRNA GlmZ degradation
MITVHLRSFSFKKQPLRGYDEVLPHGGGFVFDCRCLLNPGRQEKFKEQTGKDQGVIEFLETLPEVGVFLQSAHNLIRQAVDAYINRNFDYLSVEFGCTGGQHRSVYCVERTREFLISTWSGDLLQVQVSHVEMEARQIFTPES